MFIQVIQGPCSDAETLRDLAERWTIDLGPGAVGWLGTTYGITDDGQFVGVVRFTDRDAAERNSNRAEQSGWAGARARGAEQPDKRVRSERSTPALTKADAAARCRAAVAEWSGSLRCSRSGCSGAGAALGNTAPRAETSLRRTSSGARLAPETG